MFGFELILLSAATGLSGGAAMAWYDRARGRSARARLLREVHQLGFTIVRPSPRVIARRTVPRPTELRFTPPGSDGRRSAYLRVVVSGLPPGDLFSAKRNPATGEPNDLGLDVRGARRRAVTALCDPLRSILAPGDYLEGADDRLSLTTSAPALDRLGALLAGLARAADHLAAPASEQRATLGARLEATRDGFEELIFAAIVEGADDDLAAWARRAAPDHPSAAVRLAGAIEAADVRAVDALAIEADTPEAVATSALLWASDDGRRTLLARRDAPLGRRVHVARAAQPHELASPDWHQLWMRVAADPAESVLLRSVAIETLAASQAEDTETALLDILEHPEAGTTRWSSDKTWLQKTVVIALGQVGTERSLAVLHRLSDRAGLYAPLWQPAQAALTKLEARLGPMTAGRLSVHEPDAGGQLGIAEPRCERAGGGERPDQRNT